MAQTPGAGDFVGVQDGALVFRGQPVKLKGVNFYPKDRPWADMWNQWDGPATQRDLARVRDFGANTIRVLVPYLPDSGWTDKATGRVVPTYTNELQQLVQMAGEMQLKVIVTLFDFYDPGNDPLGPTEAARRNSLYLRDIVPLFANDDRVLAWDLHNEPDQYGTWRTDRKMADFVAWMDRVAAEIRALDSNHPLTVGMSLYDNLFVADDTGAPYPEEPVRGRTAADISDFLSFHSYNAGNIGWQIEYIKLHSKKPIVLGETGWPSGPACTLPDYSEANQTFLYNKMIEGAVAADLSGVLGWQLWDFQPGASMGAGRETHEDFFGLFRRDGTPKPAVAVLRDAWPGANASAPAPPLPSVTTSNLPLTTMPPKPAPTSPDYIPPIYFPETGHYLYNDFQIYWKKFGGLEVFGYPLTEQRLEGDYWVQYFERARFESHPEYRKKDPNWDKLPSDQRLKLQVQLTLLGTNLVGNDVPKIDAAASPAGATYFPETGHSLSGRIGEYWQSHNGLTNFGYPLTEPVQEVSKLNGKTYTVQYFERARIELHPEYAGSPYEVLLGQMGRELLASKGCK